MLRLVILGFVTALISYLLGSLNFSIIFTRIFNKNDIRTIGSGNAGLTNVVRSTNAVTSIFTLVGDFGKSILAGVIANIIFDASAHPGLSTLLALWTGFFCVIGHIFPIFFKFKGGKGVLTAAGMLIMIAPSKPIIFFVCIGIFAIFTVLTRIVSLSSIIAVLSFPFAMWFFCDIVVPDMSSPYTALLSSYYIDQRYFLTVAATAVPFVILLKHFKNIERLLESREKEFSFSHKKAETLKLTDISEEQKLQNKAVLVKLFGIIMVASCFIQQLNILKFHPNLRIPFANMLRHLDAVKALCNALAGGAFISNLMYIICIIAVCVGMIAILFMLIGVFLTFIRGSLFKKGLFICKISAIAIVAVTSLVILGTIIFNIGVYAFTSFSFRFRLSISNVIYLFSAIMTLKLISGINKPQSTETVD